MRRATLADRSLVLSFHRALYVAHREAVVPPDLASLDGYRDLDAALRDDVEALLHDPKAIVLLGERDGVVVGYVTGRTEYDPRRLHARRGIVEDWWVEPEERGQGMGRALIEGLMSAFRRAGCSVAESLTWAANSGARAAHLAAGFVEVQVRYRMLIPPR